MDFNTPIRDISKYGGSRIWNAAENYLNVGQNSYTVVKLDAKKVKLQKDTTPSQDWVFSALKVLSYFTLVLPLVALVAKAIYRSQHAHEIITYTRSNKKTQQVQQYNAGMKELGKHYDQAVKVTPTKDLIKAAVEDFKKLMRKIHSSVEESVQTKVWKVFQQSKQAETLTLKDAEKQLKAWLKHFGTYKESMDNVLGMVHQALTGLLEQPVTKEKFDIANMVYKNMSKFLRAQTSSKKEYLRELNLAFEGDKRAVSKAATYLFSDLYEADDTLPKKHEALLHELHYLRKQIKLLSEKPSDWRKRISKKQINDIPRETVDKAFNYLNISWSHGTKAIVIKSACDLTQGALLPAGELRKQQQSMLSGELGIVHGVNQRALSGVNLTNAAIDFGSIAYAKGYAFDIEEEKRLYKQLLNLKTPPFASTSLRFSLGRSIEAMKRLYRLDPEAILKDKAILKAKIDEIYQSIDSNVFKIKEPRYFSNTHDMYYAEELYEFLQVLEHLEQFLDHPPQLEKITEEDQQLANIPVVMASSTKRGMPVTLGSPHTGLAYEEGIFDPMVLGTDIQVVFTKPEHVGTIQQLLKDKGLGNSVKVESMEILETAAKIDRALGPYFYDVYGWQNR